MTTIKSPIAGFARYIDANMDCLKWHVLANLLNQITIHFGNASATGRIANDIKEVGDQLLENEMLNGVTAFLLANPLFYESHGARGADLRRKYRRFRHFMDYKITNVSRYFKITIEKYSQNSFS